MEEMKRQDDKHMANCSKLFLHVLATKTNLKYVVCNG